MIKGNVLLAHTGQMKKQVSALTSDSTVLHVTDTFLAKETALRGDIDLFIIDVHFDRSRAIEFVSFIRKFQSTNPHLFLFSKLVRLLKKLSFAQS